VGNSAVLGLGRGSGFLAHWKGCGWWVGAAGGEVECLGVEVEGFPGMQEGFRCVVVEGRRRVRVRSLERVSLGNVLMVWGGGRSDCPR
jgi:hypothetical protein